MTAHRLLLIAVVLLAPLPAAATDTPVRVGDHPGFGRLVFDLPPEARYETVRAGDRLLLVFQGAGQIETPDRTPRNVTGITGGTNSVTVLLAPGAEYRTVRMGERLVLDVLDRRPGSQRAPSPRAQRPEPAAEARQSEPEHASPAAATPPQKTEPPPVPPVRQAEPASSPHPTEPLSPEQRHVEQAPAEPPPSKPAAPVATVIVPRSPQAPTATLRDPEPRQPSLPAAPPAAIPAQAPTPPEPAKPALPAPVLLPADALTGAAAFRRGDVGIVVLDRRAAGGATAGVTAGVTAGTGNSSVLQVPLPPGTSLQLARVPSGWSVQPVQDTAPAALQPRSSPGGISFEMKKPGRVVTLQDPISGATLLVGTSLEPGSDAAEAEERRTPDFALIPTWLGVVVEALADSTDLRAVKGGFLLAGAALSPATAPLALTRRFDLPDGAAAALNNRMHAQMQGAATALPRARARERVAAAGTMISLGLAAEAQAVIQLAMTDDPQAAADAGTQALAAVAAVLAGRPLEADALDDKRLDGTDEIALWRGVRDRRLGRDTPAASSLGAMTPLALAYAPTLGRLVVPDVAEAAVETGAPFPEDRLTPYAKAVLLERRGKTAEALAAYDALTKGPNRLDQVRGTARAAELKLASGQLTPLAACRSGLLGNVVCTGRE